MQWTTLHPHSWTHRTTEVYRICSSRPARDHRDYAGGLYVDLDEFCTKLGGLLSGSESNVKTPIRDACQLVLAALGEGKSDSLILENVSADVRSHGISIYLPYLSDEQSAQVDKPMVKGGTKTGALRAET